MVPKTLSKLNVARHQLDTALDLFIKDRDAVNVSPPAAANWSMQLRLLRTFNQAAPMHH
jgi:hypothetical protein